MKYEKPELNVTSALRTIQAVGNKLTPDFEESSGDRQLSISCYEDDEW